MGGRGVEDEAPGGHRWADRIARLVSTHPVPILAATGLLALACLVPAGRLHVETDVVDLLPSGSRAATDYRLLLETFGGAEKVLVVVEAAGAAEADEVAAAARDLAATLEESPLVSGARAGLQPEDEAFFLQHVAPRALLLAGDGWRERLAARTRPEALRRRAAELRDALRSPMGFMVLETARADPLGLSGGLSGLAGAWSLPVDPMTLTFASEDGRSSLVVVTPARSEINPDTGHQLAAVLDEASAGVSARHQTPLRFSAVGGPLYAAADETLIREDLQRTVTGSVVGCLAVLVLAFGGLLVPAAILLVIAVAGVLTAACLAVTVGEISALGAGFAAVLVGLGIDYGIHGCARYREALLEGNDAREALAHALRHAGPGIVSSAATTAAAFAVLTLAALRPLEDVGIAGAVGITAIFAATLVVGGPLVTLTLGRRGGRARAGPLWRLTGGLADGVVSLGRRRPVPVLAAAALLTVAGLAGMARLHVEADLRTVRPEDHPLEETERIVAERFGLGQGTMSVVVPGEDLGAALSAGRRAAGILSDELGPGGAVTFVGDWIGRPDVVRARLAELEEMDLEPALTALAGEMRAAGLNPAGFARGFEALRALDQGRDPSPPGDQAWPRWLDELVRVDADRAWVLIPVRHSADVWEEGPPAEVLDRIRLAAPGSAVASVPAIGRDLQRLAERDLQRLAVIVLLAVVAVTAVSFRGRVGAGLLALVPAALGSVWVLGAWGWLGHRLDLMAIAVLPLLLGIGVDDGLHAVHGARGRPGDSGLASSVRSAGRAMVLTTATTCVGFGSLVLSRVPGLRSGGLLVALGVACCLAVTLAVLPALERIGTRVRGR